MARAHRRMFYLGIDPGNDGGMSLVDPCGRPVCFDRIRDLEQIVKFFRYLDNFRAENLAVITCVYEEYCGDQAAVAARSGGRYVGIFETMCFLHDIRFNKVSPQTWKSWHDLIIRQPKGVPKLSDADRYKEAKRRAMQKFRELFPDVNLVFPKCRTEHEGVAESLMIAEYGRQKSL